MNNFRRWIPGLVMMGIIFFSSAQPSNDLPNFGQWDYFLKKAGHAVGYGLLAISYSHGLEDRKSSVAWIMALLYAVTDEYHQSFVAGRHPSIVDVLVYDGLGAWLGLWIWSKRRLHEK